MPSAVQLLENDQQPRVAVDDQRLAQDEDRGVVAADFGIDAPGGIGVAVDGLENAPVLLVEVGEGRFDRHGNRLAVVTQDKQLELGKMQVAVVLPARPLPRQAAVGQHLQLKSRDRFQFRIERETVGVGLGTRAAKQ